MKILKTIWYAVAALFLAAVVIHEFPGLAIAFLAWAIWDSWGRRLVHSIAEYVSAHTGDHA